MNGDGFDVYYQTITNKQYEILKQVDDYVTDLIPEATKKIAYGMPSFYLKGYSLHFGAFKGHWSLFPGDEITESFKDELSAYQLSKGTIKIKYQQEIPFALTKKIVEYRIKQIK
ncbi:DUF1801 domain-containing protein [Erysipelotrichaceae bacterium OttesenSCG-928-M19]|nr:DUF1801 domain-containing protein [Erysipelotrichaceae bacterium OttesenSCG-928-M19]